jgi:hypothetical protein
MEAHLLSLATQTCCHGKMERALLLARSSQQKARKVDFELLGKKSGCRNFTVKPEGKTKGSLLVCSTS